jgi:nucleotide-binding universal stress UspA family protein
MTVCNRVVHSTDFSPAAEPAFAYALETAKRDGAELLLVHALGPLVAFVDEAYVSSAVVLRDAGRDAARKGFDVLLARAKDAGVKTVDILVEGWPPEEITKVATQFHADLIVMGTHGRTGLSRRTRRVRW